MDNLEERLDEIVGWYDPLSVVISRFLVKAIKKRSIMDSYIQDSAVIEEKRMTDTEDKNYLYDQEHKELIQKCETMLQESKDINTKYLEEWFNSNSQYPYPTADDVDMLSRKSGMTDTQVKKFFSNKRTKTRTTLKPRGRPAKRKRFNPPCNDIHEDFLMM